MLSELLLIMKIIIHVYSPFSHHKLPICICYPAKVPCSICHCVQFSTTIHSDLNHANFLHGKLQKPEAAALWINTLEPGSWSTPAWSNTLGLWSTPRQMEHFKQMEYPRFMEHPRLIEHPDWWSRSSTLSWSSAPDWWSIQADVILSNTYSCLLS